MAREATITQEQVNVAADAIRAAGNKPTNRAVLDVLGSGSMATIVKYMQVWKSGQERHSQTIDDEIDVSVSNAISNMLARRIQESTSEANGKVAELQADLATVIVENERQAGEIESLTADLAEIRAQAQTQMGQIEELKAAALRLQDSTATAIREAHTQAQRETDAREAAQVALAKAELRLEALPRLDAEIDRLRQLLDAETTRANGAEKSAAVSTARFESAQEQAKAAEQREAKTQSRLDAQDVATSKAAAEAAELRGKLAGAAQELDDARRDYRDQLAAANKANADAAELRRKLAGAAAEKKPAK